MQTAGGSRSEASNRQIFRTTDWSAVRRAVDLGQSGSALNHLCELYWKPLYYFARRKGHNPEEAQDLTQGFFATVLEKEYLHIADQRRGRFRGFILAAFENFLRNSWAHAHRAKRGGRAVFVSLDLEMAESTYERQQLCSQDAAIAFDKGWAFSLVEAVLDKLRSEFTKAGKASQFILLEPFLGDSADTLRYAAIAKAMDASEAAIRVAVHRLRTRYGKLLRQAVADTLVDKSEVDDELRYLLAVLIG